ncbi:hypothetical protein PGT21_029861 [Puccinia graminis f. sp. tritici]|uniref:Uncharacterized protein n=1 Tax=Puccinia graminis f. sp. tritici TaxID=56615 RepID=A0A5B0Q7C0_PUCGR|nr:hypothetical protein PGT21_028868 [Puccinia graminis f. sp. tritici]KAA1108963.1 hypothetical protein PGT21_029861 [Puccinia graminis f. sp. tritici]KAA1121580.1 hypothetical protein PGTUg99_032652 [Puccinia graminis f. sp. tritici]KAA1122477.1 hypothetical protein PGTUg99_037672 [Puccinia graminis f. sp. tritici]
MKLVQCTAAAVLVALVFIAETAVASTAVIRCQYCRAGKPVDGYPFCVCDYKVRG